jgi:hypothetical protein
VNVPLCLFCGKACDGDVCTCGADCLIHGGQKFSTQKFNGSDYDPEFDDARLRGQIRRLWDLMLDGKWRTLCEIELVTGDPPASISAQLRHLRKKRFGKHTVNKRPRGERAHGLWEYQLVPHQL